MNFSFLDRPPTQLSEANIFGRVRDPKTGGGSQPGAEPASCSAWTDLSWAETYLLQWGFLQLIDLGNPQFTKLP